MSKNEQIEPKKALTADGQGDLDDGYASTDSTEPSGTLTVGSGCIVGSLTGVGIERALEGATCVSQSGPCVQGLAATAVPAGGCAAGILTCVLCIFGGAAFRAKCWPGAKSVAEHEYARVPAGQAEPRS